MPAKAKGGLNSSKPVSFPQEVGNKCSAIDEFRKEISRIEKETEETQKKINEYEQSSLQDIQQYRAKIDSQTSTINAIKHKIEDVYNEMNAKKKQLRDENEAKKNAISHEKAEVEKEIETLTNQLEVIKKFEQEKESIAAEIQAKEAAIEGKKKEFEESKSQTEKATKDLIERGLKANEEAIEKCKEDYYDELLSNTDQAVLLHIQRRNNYENDMLSLQEMFKDYTDKIQARETANSKLRETIESLKRDELIKRSADQRQNITTLRKEVKNAKAQLNELVEKSKVTLEQNDKDREEEAKKMELSLKYQQDKLDHKLQQIQALRELTLTVLSFRSQLEAEFITVLGEKIFEVSHRNNPDQRDESRATRKLSLNSSSNSSINGSSRMSQTGALGSSSRRTGAIPRLNNQISINHVLAQLTLEERIEILQRFLTRVHGEVEDDIRTDTPILNDDSDIPKPSSV